LSGGNNDVTVSGGYGSAFANQPFGAGIGNTATNPRGVATSANYYGIETSYRFSPRFTLSGWVGYTQAIVEDGAASTAVKRGDKADIWNWAVTLAFPDLGKKGNLGGIIFGQPPKVTSNEYSLPAANATSAPTFREDTDTSYHVEVLYRYQVNPNLSITPGLIVIFNPEHNSNNDTIYTGLIRTTFRF
jgi:Carbohydrate-selective porin, OprB family